MTPRNTLVLLGAYTALMLLACACGGDDDSAAPTDTGSDSSPPATEDSGSGSDTGSDTGSETGSASETGSESTATDVATDTETDTGPVPVDTDTWMATGTDDYGASFTRYTIDSDIGGPSFATLADLDGDGSLELIYSAFGILDTSVAEIPLGWLEGYEMGATLATWTKKTLMPTTEGIRFPNNVNAVDVDGDDDLDLVVPYGFVVCNFPFFTDAQCGGLAWFEQTADAWVRHDIVPNGQQLFYHQATLADLDGDGATELVTVAEDGLDVFGIPHAAVVQFFDRLSPTTFSAEPVVLSEGLGGNPLATDIDGDGDLDLVSGEYFYGQGVSFAWLEQIDPPGTSNPSGTWLRHIIADDVGGAFQISLIPDLLGDGQARFVGANHTNTGSETPAYESAVYLFTVPADPTTPWPKTMISQGLICKPNNPGETRGAPGVFSEGDVDGDGDLDLALSGDGDPRFYVLVQNADHTFTTRVLQYGIDQAGGAKIADFDSDGDGEIVVSGYKANAVYIYDWHGTP